jgi:RNA polymerase sigma-70 factor (ECF subfamily)
MLPGSEQAFTLFYKEHAAKFFYYCTRFIDNDDEAKAIVDEQFARMWEKRTKFKTVNDLRAYMYASLRNACFRYLKVAKEGADPNSPAVEALAVEESIDHQMVRTELMNALYERIQQLSPQKREVMELLYFQDMTIAQAAEKMGISEEAVRQNKHRALTELRHKAITDKLLLLCLFLLR